MTLLAVEHLGKRFGGLQAVDDVSFALEPGEIVALIGPNGAGKTTCFNMLMGQLAPDAGRILLDDEDVTGWAPRRLWRKGVARTFQITAILPSFTVRENVQVALLSHRGRLLSLVPRAGRELREEADALLARVGMVEQAERACGILAYGDLKRVELAVALANEPRLLLMDEPTAGMATAERGRLMDLVRELSGSRGIGVLFTEHDMDVVFGHAQRVIVLARGRLIAEGTPHAVRADPMVQEVYLGAPAEAA